MVAVVAVGVGVIVYVWGLGLRSDGCEIAFIVCCYVLRRCVRVRVRVRLWFGMWLCVVVWVVLCGGWCVYCCRLAKACGRCSRRVLVLWFVVYGG